MGSKNSTSMGSIESTSQGCNERTNSTGDDVTSDRSAGSGDGGAAAPAAGRCRGTSILCSTWYASLSSSWHATHTSADADADADDDAHDATTTGSWYDGRTGSDGATGCESACRVQSAYPRSTSARATICITTVAT